MASGGEFTNKVAIVTGASSGMGQATAIFLAKKGASVVLCGRDEARLQSSLDQCVEASDGKADRFTSAIGDLTKSEVRKATIDKAIDSFQRLDILVANAGLVKVPMDGVFTEEIYDELFDVNLKSVFFLIQNAVPHLEKTGGNIVSVSSYGSTVAINYNSVYAMTKAAIDHMTRCLALDLAPKGIRVNAVNPSFVQTRLLRHLCAGNEEMEKAVQARESGGQLLYGKCVTAEAVADLIGFLASDSAKFITGQCHIIDGGRSFCGNNP